MSELLQELRVALPGVQVLFAFLLTVPFTQRFAQITPFQQNVYFVTLLCSAAATLLLIAPAAHHRIEFRQHDKEHLVKVSTRFALAGTVALALAMTGAVLLVTDVLFKATVTAITVAAVAGAFAVLWYALPLLRLRGRDGDDASA